MDSETIRAVAVAVAKRVAELSDRSSPDDWPEAMLVTSDELIHIVSDEIAETLTEDEVYEIGKRDGYEDAVQDIDLETGGDGEFKGSTIPGATIDVPAMKARIVDRLAK